MSRSEPSLDYLVIDTVLEQSNSLRFGRNLFVLWYGMGCLGMENELILCTTCIVKPHIWIIPSSFTLTRNHVIQVGTVQTMSGFWNTQQKFMLRMEGWDKTQPHCKCKRDGQSHARWSSRQKEEKQIISHGQRTG